MKFRFILLFILVSGIFPPTVGYSAGDCPVMSVAACVISDNKCTTQPNQLTVSGSIYEIVSAVSAGGCSNSCCRLTCVADASFTNNNCQCKAGYFKDNNSCQKCAPGSYSATGASSCTVCPNGFTNSAANQNTSNSSCTTPCTNGTNVATWKTPQWNNNVVTDLCTIASCANGYHLDPVNCTANTYEIQFWGVGGFTTHNGNQSGNPQCTYGTTCSWDNTYVPSGYNGYEIGWSLYGVAQIVAVDSLPATFTTANGLGTVIPAQRGTVNLYVKLTQCKDNTGYVNAATWTAGKCEITQCNPGYHLTADNAKPVGKQSACEPCPTGTIKDKDGKYCNGTSIVEDCPKGWYCPDGNKNPCPAGHTTLDKGAVNKCQCTMIGIGGSANPALSACGHA